MAGRSRGRGRWIAAAAAGLWLAAPATGQGQYVQFEPPAYIGSPEGEPLEGQDGWYSPGPGGGGHWLVYTADATSFGLPPGTASLRQFIGAQAADRVVEVQRGLSVELDLVLRFEIAVGHGAPLPEPGLICRVSLEPESVRSTFALAMRWADPTGTDRWTIEAHYYDSAGSPHEAVPTAGFDQLGPRTWYEVEVEVRFDTNEIVVLRLLNKVTGVRSTYVPAGWYMAGGALGTLGPPTAVQLTAGDGVTLGSLVAVDNLFAADFYPCYVDCDRNGTVDLFDFLCYQNLFAAGDRYAECDGTGQLDLFDFLCFQNLFYAGCRP